MVKPIKSTLEIFGVATKLMFRSGTYLFNTLEICYNFCNSLLYSKHDLWHVKGPIQACTALIFKNLFNVRSKIQCLETNPKTFHVCSLLANTYVHL